MSCISQRFEERNMQVREFDAKNAWADFTHPRKITLNNLKSDRRKILFIQTAYMLVYYVYVCIPMDFPARVDLLYLIWQSVSDSYLTHQELEDAAFELKMKDSDWTKLYTCYETFVSSSKSFSIPTPRSLSHFCRCKIRAVLGKNYALPDGIEQLRIPNSLKAFLRLEISDQPITRMHSFFRTPVNT
ncbi:hypothetical protein TNCV_2157041 [Trichonephila clavipes]|nr:hypothetical protein TNCV_2157041 [Trichonephila clavipes]